MAPASLPEKVTDGNTLLARTLALMVDTGGAETVGAGVSAMNWCCGSLNSAKSDWMTDLIRSTPASVYGTLGLPASSANTSIWIWLVRASIPQTMSKNSPALSQPFTVIGMPAIGM